MCCNIQFWRYDRRETDRILKDFGGDDEEGTPVPIPNTAVKLFDADDSWTATSCENM